MVGSSIFRYLIVMVLVGASALAAAETEQRQPLQRRRLRGLQTYVKRGNSIANVGTVSSGTSSPSQAQTITLKVTVTNAACSQPLSRFFVMVHDTRTPPLFTMGRPASEQLALLAEFGDAQPLVDYYKQPANSVGVSYVGIHSTGAPYLVGDQATITLTVSPTYRYVTIAAMATNTNDCFIALNGEKISPGDKFELPGLDAGSEANNELCSSMPGSACDDIDTTNIRSLGGEGVVHVHRGFQGVGDLRRDIYDWRNPMAYVAVSR